MPSFERKTALVTGATDGLGRALALELAARGVAVLVHGRDEQRGQETVSEIRGRVPGAELHWLQADLSSLEQVRNLAARVEREHQRLDVLICNAGVGPAEPRDGSRALSADGDELHFAVNHLAHFLLIRSLLPLLTRSAPARIVQVASGAQTPIDFGDVMLARGYNSIQAYCQSKLAQIMFTLDLAEGLEGSGVTVNCLHPGTYLPTKMVAGADVPAYTPLEVGVSAVARLALDRELERASGLYFDVEQPATPHAQALDRDARRRLRELSEQLCGIGERPTVRRAAGTLSACSPSSAAPPRRTPSWLRYVTQSRFRTGRSSR